MDKSLAGNGIPSLRITTGCNCNHRCSFCQLEGDYASVFAAEQCSSGRIDISSIQRFIDEGVRHFSLTGGEPLTNPGDTFKVAKFIKIFLKSERSKGYNDNYLRLNTNGVYVHRHLRAIKKYFDLVKISLHTFSTNLYGQITNSRNPKRDLEHTLNGICQLEAEQVPMRIQFIVLRSNCHEVFDMINFCEQHPYITELKLFDLSEYSLLWAAKEHGHAFWAENYVSLEKFECEFESKYTKQGTFYSVGGYGNPMNVYKTTKGLRIRVRRSDKGAFYGTECSTKCNAFQICRDGHCNLGLSPNGVIKVCRPREGKVFGIGEERVAIQYFRGLQFCGKDCSGSDQQPLAVQYYHPFGGQNDSQLFDRS